MGRPGSKPRGLLPERSRASISSGSPVMLQVIQDSFHPGATMEASIQSPSAPRQASQASLPLHHDSQIQITERSSSRIFLEPVATKCQDRSMTTHHRHHHYPPPNTQPNIRNLLRLLRHQNKSNLPKEAQVRISANLSLAFSKKSQICLYDQRQYLLRRTNPKA